MGLVACAQCCDAATDERAARHDGGWNQGCLEQSARAASFNAKRDSLGVQGVSLVFHKCAHPTPDGSGKEPAMATGGILQVARLSKAIKRRRRRHANGKPPQSVETV